MKPISEEFNVALDLMLPTMIRLVVWLFLSFSSSLLFYQIRKNGRNSLQKCRVCPFDRRSGSWWEIQIQKNSTKCVLGRPSPLTVVDKTTSICRRNCLSKDAVFLPASSRQRLDKGQRMSRVTPLTICRALHISRNSASRPQRNSKPEQISVWIEIVGKETVRADYLSTP